jgi:hypothetical protein
MPLGEPVPTPADTPPGSSGTQELPRAWNALILPVAFTLAAWAVDRFTRSALGDWRYVLVAILGLCAIYFTVLALVVILALNVDKIDRHRVPRRLARPMNVLFAMVIAAAVIVEIVRAVRDDSAVDAVTALVIVVWIRFIPGYTDFASMPRGRRRAYRAASLLLPVWVLVVTLFHLH